MAEKVTILEVDIDFDKAVQDTLAYKQQSIQLNKELKEIEVTEGKLSEAYIKKEAELKASNDQVRQSENLTKKLTAAHNEEIGTLQKLEAENAKLRSEQRGLNLTTEEGIKRNKEINSKLNENTKFIKSNVDSMTKQKMSIGDYAQSLSGMGQPLGGIINGFMGMAKAAWAFIATPIGSIIAAIVGVVTLLYNIFKKFEPVIEFIERKVAAVVAVFNVFKNAIVGLVAGGKSLSEAFSGMGASMADAAREAENLKRAQQELEDQQILQIETEAKEKRQIDELLLKSKDRTKSEKERIALIDEALKVEEASYNRKKKLADDEYNNKVREIAISNQLTDIEEKNLKEQGAAYLQQLQETKIISDEEVRVFAEASAKREQVLNESVAIREKALSKQNALLEKQEEKEQKALEEFKKRQDEKIAKELEVWLNEGKLWAKQAQEANDRAVQEQEWVDRQAEIKESKRRADRDKERADKLKHSEWLKNQHLIDFENSMQIQILNNENKFEIERKYLEAERQLAINEAMKTGADLNIIEDKFAAARKQINRQELIAKVQAFEQFSGQIAGLYGESTAIGKAAAVAQTGANTYLSATAAYAGMVQAIPGPVGIVAGFAAAAASVAMGLKNIKKILSIKSGLPNDKSPSISISGGGGDGGGAIARQTTAPTIGQGIVSRNTNLQTNTTNVVNSTVLVENEVTVKQNRTMLQNQAAIL